MNHVPNPNGLVNVRNSCFLNSVLQVLFRHPSIVRHCLPLVSSAQKNWAVDANAKKWIEHPTLLMKHPLAQSAGADQSKQHCWIMFLRLWIANVVYTNVPLIPETLVSHLVRHCPSLYSGQHQDAHECLMYWLDVFEHVLPPAVCQEWQGTSTLHISCQCGFDQQKQETFNHLSLPLGESLEDAVARYQNPEVLEEYRCDRCNQQTVTQRTAITQWPRHVWIQWKRFQFQQAQGKGVGRLNKINARIPVARSFDIDDAAYRLIGLLIHQGSAQNGHYVCMVEHGGHMLPAYQPQWLWCDDSKVNVVLEDLLGSDDVTKNAYVLLYSRMQ